MIPLRGVFSSGDAWMLTGDLFRRDADGDLWRVDNLAEVVRTADGPVFTGPIRDALGDVPAVDLVVAYGVPLEGSEYQLAVAAVTLRAGRDLGPKDVAGALRGLPPEQRPRIVHVVESIPVTTWFRPVTSPLREAGIPEPGEDVQAWFLDAGGGATARSPRLRTSGSPALRPSRCRRRSPRRLSRPTRDRIGSGGREWRFTATPRRELPHVPGERSSALAERILFERSWGS